jgi:toxin FitB
LNYLLDTNIISELISKQPSLKVITFIEELDEKNVYLSVMTIGEIKAGIEKLDNGIKKEKLSLWLHNDLLERFRLRIIEIDVNIMLAWGEITQKSKVLGKPLPIIDSIIGATCKAKELLLITRNEKDFQNLDIKITNPFI